MKIVAGALITAIIPIRLSSGNLYDEVERIERIIETIPSGFVVLIVDYGTGPEREGELRAVAAKYNVQRVRVETGDVPFSIGHARDIGTQHAKTPLVMYHDIDFLMSRESYGKVLSECRLRNMPDNAYAFFALPGAYLTQEFTEEYLRLLSVDDGAYADILVHDGLMRHDKEVYETNTYAISAIVANRYHLLALGGHDKSFKGHGAEDFELMHRLTSYYKKGPRPRDYYKNTKSNSILNYEGFRAYYALYGIDVFQRGIVIAHLWHPRRKDVGYVGTNNQARVSDVMADYDQGRTFLQPLDDETSNEKTLVLVNPGTSPARALRHAYPAMGHHRIVPEKSFNGADDLIEFIREEGFTRVFFLNPYGNEHRLELYRGIKSAGIRFVAYDRGAYNNSWFFDSRGFLADSGSYSPEFWDRPLSDDERSKTALWISALRLSDETLEANGARTGREHLRQALKLGDRKMLFVALQRPSDTATVHFSGPCNDAYTFNTWVSKLASSVDRRKYVVVVKKHPLETARPNIDGVVFAPDEAHIADLIELSEKVVVINSGAGLLAVTYGKPVICCGQSFYCHPGLAWQANNPKELATLAQCDIATDDEKRIRFVRYLVDDFYSFGISQYDERPAGGGNRIASKTFFSEIRGLTEMPLKLGEIPQGSNLDAPLFYSFGGRQGIKNDGATTAEPRSPNALELMRLGSKAYHAKEFADAAKYFEHACILNAANPGYFRSAAEAFYRAGDSLTAASYLEKALAISPSNKSISRRIREMRRPKWMNSLLWQRPFPVKQH